MAVIINKLNAFPANNYNILPKGSVDHQRIALALLIIMVSVHYN